MSNTLPIEELTDLLDHLVIGDNPVTGEHRLEIWKDGNITDAKEALLAWHTESIVGALPSRKDQDPDWDKKEPEMHPYVWHSNDGFNAAITAMEHNLGIGKAQGASEQPQPQEEVGGKQVDKQSEVA